MKRYDELKNDFRMQFVFIYEKEPTELQLTTFMNFMLGIETDVEKVIQICNEDAVVMSQPEM